MSRLRVFLLGSFHATLDGEPLTNFESDKARALLAYLAVEADRPHRRESLAGLLWPDTPERIARTNLRSALANLRQVICDHEAQLPFLCATRQTIQLNADSDYWVDINAFRAEIDSYLDSLRKKVPIQIPALEDALDLYRGQPMAGFSLRDAPLFEEWALITREALQRSALKAMHRLVEHYHGIGEHEKALELALRQVDLEPYQEAAHQQVMWAFASCGQRNKALLHYDEFKALLQTELGVDPLEETRSMYERLVNGQLPDTPRSSLVLRREPRVVGECPYRGLSAFRELDAPFFYGREAFTKRLIEKTQEDFPLALVVGSSGSGKSSAIFAGILPQLREAGNWLLMSFRPGKEPFQALATALFPHIKPKTYLNTQTLANALQEGEISFFEVLQQQNSSARMLLVIDQFEEIYTLCSDTLVRQEFLDALLAAIKAGDQTDCSPFGLVLTLRADFMGQALSYRPFADRFGEKLLVLGPMSQPELRAAIEKPAEVQGAAFEPGLVTRILNDVGEEPGKLPLLEFALTELWSHLDQGWLTHAAYEEIGQTKGALARYADSIYLGLNEKIQHDARRVFVQLVQPGQGTEDTRRLASRTELGEENWQLIQHFADKRLVVTDQDEVGNETAEIIHEALIQEWKCLRDWINADRSFRIWQEEMRTALNQWEANQRARAALLRGVSLSKAENWLIERNDDLNALERQFIQASLRARQERQQAESIRQARERALERRSRTFLQVLAVVLLLATSISIGFALVARQEARQANEAASLSLAANARQMLNDKDTTTALVLAMAANRIEQPPHEAQRVLLDAAFSPGPRRLFDVSETFEGVEGPPLSMAITPDGETALTGFFDGTIIAWNIETGTENHLFQGHAPGNYDPVRIVAHSGVNDIALSPSGLLAISGGDDGLVVVWDIRTGEEIQRFEGHSGAVRAVAVSPDELMVISGGVSGTSQTDPGELILWDLETGQEIRRFEGQAEAIVDVAISPDGQTVMASSGEVDYVSGVEFQTYSLILWDIETGEIIHRFEEIDRDVPGLAISADGKFALTASTDHNLTLWDMESGQKIQTLEGHTDLVRTVAFSPDGQRAISGGGDGEMFLWDLEKGEILARFDAHTESVSDIAFMPDGRSALSVGDDGAIILWDLVNAAQLNRFEGHEAAVLDVAYTPNGNHFVSASGQFDPAAPIVEEDSLRLWNLENGAQTGAFDWHVSDIFQMDISPDGRRALSGNMTDQSLRLWDLATGTTIRRFEGHDIPLIFSVAFAPDGRRGLSGAMDSTIILWDLETGEALRRLSGHEGVIWALAVSPNGHTALSGADDRLLIWWDLDTGQEIQRFAGHIESVSGVVFSPDGKRAISGDTKGLVIEWDLQTGEEIQRLAAHTGTGSVGRTRVAYLQDGFTALSSGWDGSLALWDLKAGEEIHRFRGHDTDFIFDIAVSPDNSTALSCGTDQTIIQWQLDIPRWGEVPKWVENNRYVRELTCDEKDLYQIEPLCKP